MTKTFALNPLHATLDLALAAAPATAHPQSLLDLPPGEARESLLTVHGILEATLPAGSLSIYEAGGGSTSFLPLNVLRRAHVTVVDIDEDQICNNDYAQEAILGDIQTHRFPPASFDLIICYNVIEHVPDVEAALSGFCEALKDRLTDPASGFGKAYLRLLVDEVRLEGRELKIRGSYTRLADAIGLLEKKKLGEVPSFVRNWRARWDLNPRPPGY